MRGILVGIFNCDGERFARGALGLPENSDDFARWDSHEATLATTAKSIIQNQHRITVFSGDIFNASELRARHGLPEQLDVSETLAELYAKLGADVLTEIDGGFAAIIYDSDRHRVTLLTDIFGQERLFYHFSGKTLLVASCPRALLKFPQVSAELDLQSARRFLSAQFLTGSATAYRNVKSTLLGAALEFDLNSGSVKGFRANSPSVAVNSALTEAEAVKQLREILRGAVRRRQNSDFGAFLSGGVDSAVVAGTAAESASSFPVVTCGCATPMYDEQPDADAAFARINRNNGGLRHIVGEFGAKDLELHDRIFRDFGGLFGDASLLPTAAACQLAAQHTNFMLSGDGGDELFFGYERYTALDFSTALGRWCPFARPLCQAVAKILPDGGERDFRGRLRRILNFLGDGSPCRYGALFDRLPPELATAVLGPIFSPELIIANPLENFTATDGASAARLDLSLYLPYDTQLKTLLARRAANLSVSSPFLSPEMVRFAQSLPPKLKYQNDVRKYLIRKAFPEFLPTKPNRKRGFGVPMAEYLRGAWKESAEALIFGGKLIFDGWVKESGLREIWAEHQDGRRDFSYALWSFRQLALLLENR